ncbi:MULTISPECIES: MSHA biogenesis protein MshP [Vibrio]|uniref:MSHA biogenesis protein MshP n=1 Tax=Vibrio TaxID=662 RepID=UPI001A8CDCDA|nr:MULTISPECIES: MSHA biogenesis protein MshP [Vibrio]ELB2769613.1 MSHA biogenesis protein MshP [Vibrio alginolyticus]MBO0211262.1 MSHA biogenesis protein MshP [Vibrio sp. Vb0877]MCR9439627.1 MSHA biogenesis protein MshP [Vibrio alginolyticus]MCS0105267.1 MSHA biogenesis protein MshP [Vibrio alginolyticus]MDW1665076.1 MSHA biogenesis protein MshP [Vibrio sp. Vb2656]
MFRKKHQQGNVLVIVLFVIVVMGYLAASLMRVTWSNQSGVTREFLGTQAWFVAQSANEWALTKLYPLNVSSASASVSTLCKNQVSGATPNVTQGTGCRINSMSCVDLGTLNAGTSAAESLFRVQATAVCGSGLSKVQRQQEIWVRE